MTENILNAVEIEIWFNSHNGNTLNKCEYNIFQLMKKYLEKYATRSKLFNKSNLEFSNWI